MLRATLLGVCLVGLLLHSATTVRALDPAGGGFVVVWHSGATGVSGTQDGAEFGIFGQRFAANGSPQGAGFQISVYATGRQVRPQVAHPPDGSFLMVWKSDEQDGTLDGAFGQAYQPRNLACGDASGDGNVTATDALQALTTAVGAGSCALYACDVDSSGSTMASDALRIRQSAVGQAVMLTCASC